MYARKGANVPARGAFTRYSPPPKKDKRLDIGKQICYNDNMLQNEAKIVALGAAANAACETTAPSKAAVSAAVAYLTGKTDKAAFFKKSAKSPLYARLIAVADGNAQECTAESFCAVHKALYEPKAKCGELRSGELTLTGGSCTPPNLLRGSLKNVLAKLEQVQGAPAAGKTDFAANLCCYLRELLILSPFTYGNDAARRAYLQNFCMQRGFLLNYAAVSKKELTAAETTAFASDDPQPLFTLLVKCLSYQREEPPKKRRARTVPAPARQLPEKAPAEKEKAPRKTITAPAKSGHEEIAAAERRNRVAVPAPVAARPPLPDKPTGEKQPLEKATAEPQKATRTETEILRELKDVQRALAALTVRVSELIKDLSDKS